MKYILIASSNGKDFRIYPVFKTENAQGTFSGKQIIVCHYYSESGDGSLRPRVIHVHSETVFETFDEAVAEVDKTVRKRIQKIALGQQAEIAASEKLCEKAEQELQKEQPAKIINCSKTLIHYHHQ